jgi:hypothetical protein
MRFFVIFHKLVELLCKHEIGPYWTTVVRIADNLDSIPGITQLFVFYCRRIVFLYRTAHLVLGLNLSVPSFYLTYT